MMRILSAASECLPFIKTGGLADAVANLARALSDPDRQVTVVIPAYRQVLRSYPHTEILASVQVAGMTAYVRRLQTTAPPVWLIDIPECFDREGGAYEAPDGTPWADDPVRFSAFSEVVARLAGGLVGDLPPFHIVHCHDWHTGLVPAWLLLLRIPVPTLFTVHNALYQGLFPEKTFRHLGFPATWWTPEMFEFHGQFSFLKAGLVMADLLTTVSPRHVRELCSGWQAGGLDGVFRSRQGDFKGILNGIDYQYWNPRHDTHIYPTFDRETVRLKTEARTRLRLELGLADTPGVPLVAVVSRLVWQKGLDLLPSVIERLPVRSVQWVIMGTGDSRIEAAFVACAERHVQSVRFIPRFDEPLAHRVFAAADFFCMPSRYEPCGLTHLQAMRYGAIPVVASVGGLADTVIDAVDPGGQGLVFGMPATEDEADAIVRALERALLVWQDQPRFMMLRDHAMAVRFDWHVSARAYGKLFSQLYANHRGVNGGCD